MTDQLRGSGATVMLGTPTMYRLLLEEGWLGDGRMQLIAGGEVLPHTHPGVEMGYVIEGRATLRVVGQPSRSLSAGDSFAIPARTIHRVRNDGPGALTMLSTYVVEKGQPIASPAPWPN